MSNISHTTFYNRSRIKTVLPLPLWPLPFHGLILFFFTTNNQTSNYHSLIWTIIRRDYIHKNLFRYKSGGIFHPNTFILKLSMLG